MMMMMMMTPNTAKFRRISTKACKISAVKNLCSQKTGPKFTKIPYDLLRTNVPHCAKFHRARPKDERGER